MYQGEKDCVVLEKPADVSRVQRIGAAFSIPSWWYCIRGMYLLTFTYRCFVWTQLRFFAKNLSDRHLEIPAGDGTLLSLMLRLRWFQRKPVPAYICAADISEGMLRNAQRRFAKRDQIEVAYGDVGALQAPDGHYTSINIANGFHCFPEPEKAVAECFRVLAPGGSVAVNALLHPRSWFLPKRIAQGINRRAIKKGILNTTFEEEDVIAMFRDRGFEVQERRVHGNTLHAVFVRPESQESSS